MCRSSTAAAARQISGPVLAAGGAIPPVGEGGPQALPTRMHESPGSPRWAPRCSARSPRPPRAERPGTLPRSRRPARRRVRAPEPWPQQTWPQYPKRPPQPPPIMRPSDEARVPLPRYGHGRRHGAPHRVGRGRPGDGVRRRVSRLADLLRQARSAVRVPHADRVHAPVPRLPRGEPQPRARDRRRVVVVRTPPGRPGRGLVGRRVAPTVRRAGRDRRLDHRLRRGTRGGHAALRGRLPRARDRGDDRRAGPPGWRCRRAELRAPDGLDRAGDLRAAPGRDLRARRERGARLP